MSLTTEEAIQIRQTLVRVGRRLGRAGEVASKPQHLLIEVQALGIQAGRLLLQAIHDGAFPQSREDRNRGWWDWSTGRVPGSGFLRDANGEPVPFAGVTDEQVSLSWMFAVGSWLVKKFPTRFRHGAASLDWSTIARDEEGQPIRDESGRFVRVEEQYDDQDALALLRSRAQTYADACLLLAELIPTPVEMLLERLDGVLDAISDLRSGQALCRIGRDLRNQGDLENGLEQMRESAARLEREIASARAANVGVDREICGSLGTKPGQWSRELNESLRYVVSTVVTSGGEIPDGPAGARFAAHHEDVRRKRQQLEDIDTASIGHGDAAPGYGPPRVDDGWESPDAGPAEIEDGRAVERESPSLVPVPGLEGVRLDAEALTVHLGEQPVDLSSHPQRFFILQVLARRDSFVHWESVVRQAWGKDDVRNSSSVKTEVDRLKRDLRNNGGDRGKQIAKCIQRKTIKGDLHFRLSREARRP